MIYRNTKTGAVIESQAVITGGRWEVILPAPEAPAQETESIKDEKPKTVKKKPAKR